MAAQFKEGDRVRIADREATAEDAKSGLFQNHFRGLTGTIQKFYSATNEVVVEVDQATLAESIATRHLEMQEQMKNKWLDGLSEEARNRLTPKERDFKLRYTVLVSANDLKAA
jgi:ribosomal protein L21E